MSIHRPKRVNYRPTREPSSFGEAANKEEKPLEWSDAVGQRGDDEVKAYVVKQVYAVQDLVRHPKFGVGVVVAVEPQKIDVLFESGVRKLAHAL